jgi:flagellar hook-associated protein 2
VDGTTLNGLQWPTQAYSSVADLGQALQTTLNNALAQSANGQGKGVTVTVDKNTGGLLLQSDSTGSSSSVTVLNGLEPAGFAAGMTISGQSNVAGTIGGYTAVGNGSTLTGGVGTPVAGLALKVNGGSTGSRGTVSVTHGFANALNDILDQMQSEKGVVGSRMRGLNDSVTSIGKNIDGFNQRLNAVKQRYYAQYNAMDRTVSKMTSLGNYLTQQFSSLSNSSNKKSS